MSAPAANVGAVVGDETGSGVGVAVREAVSPVALDMSMPMSSMCDSACPTDASAVCTIAGGLTVTTLFLLLLVTRRDTFLGLLARARPRAVLRRRRRHRPSWTVLSPISLCVLRV